MSENRGTPRRATMSRAAQQRLDGIKAQGPCPNCGKDVTPGSAHAPFCSEKCESYGTRVDLPTSDVMMRDAMARAIATHFAPLDNPETPHAVDVIDVEDDGPFAAMYVTLGNGRKFYIVIAPQD